MVSSTEGSPTYTGWKRRSRAASFSTYLPIFVQGGGADAAQFAAGQGGLEQVGRVAAPLGPPGPHHRVQLVDEQDHVARVGDLPQHGLQPLLELAAILGAGHQGPHVQGHHAAVLKAFGHVGVDDPQGQALDDGRLAHARLADQHRVVLGPPREDLHHAADLAVAADHRVQLALPGPLDQVDPVPLQGLELGLRVLVRNPRAAADRLQGLEHLLVRHGVQLEQALGLRIRAAQRQQQVLGGDELVLHGVGLALGSVQHAAQLGGDLRRRAATDLRQASHFGIDDAFQLPAIGADPLQERADHALALAQQGPQQVQGLDLRMAPLGGQRLRSRHGLLALDRQFVESEGHNDVPVRLLRSGDRLLVRSKAAGPGPGPAVAASSSCHFHRPASSRDHRQIGPRVATPSRLLGERTVPGSMRPTTRVPRASCAFRRRSSRRAVRRGADIAPPCR